MRSNSEATLNLSQEFKEDFLMSKISADVKATGTKARKDTEIHTSEIKTNFMGGESYVVDPIMTMKMMTASAIFGEPSYYMGSSLGNKESYAEKEIRESGAAILGEHLLFFRDLTGEAGDVVSAMETAIDNALKHDFEATIRWAVTLRKEYLIRLNPQVIMVRAAMHENRIKFTSENPGEFNKVNKIVMSRADDCMAQMAYYIYKNGSKAKVPSILKRSWADKLSSLSAYQVSKYKSHEIGMINAVRICHAHSSVIDELMQTGTVEISQSEETWERLRSAGKSWKEIFETVDMGHMALLRNLRNFLQEVDDIVLTQKYLEKLKSGVKTGKQFPFRYYSAFKALNTCDGINNRRMGLDALEECMDISLDNMPKLHGRTVCLSDNSGSAWNGLTTEYGSVVVAEIDNLSSVITAMRSDVGAVVKFGDTIKVFEISKRRGVLEQANEISEGRYSDVGGNTEGGIWEFLNKATENNEHWDHIFIYSDQQAGTGGLYGTDAQSRIYREQGLSCQHRYSVDYINVFEMILRYRKKVNPKVNVFSVQTAGYDNFVVPQSTYRTSLLYGWTGREPVYADVISKLWDEAEQAK